MSRPLRDEIRVRVHWNILKKTFTCRIALAVNSVSELPVDREVATRDSERGPWSVSAKIDPSPAAPVLMDGLWPHTAKTTTPAEHGYNKDGDYIDHQCASLDITADPAKPADKRWPAVRQSLGS